MRLTLIVLGLLCWSAHAADETASGEGQLHAIVEILPDGEIDVVRIVGDLPEAIHPEIALWLKDQAIQLAVDQTDEAPSRTTVQIAYRLIEDADGGQGVVLDLVASGVAAPAELPAAAPGDDIDVRVQVSREGKVEWVRPLEALPPGVSEKVLEAAVRADIENDPEVQRAAEEGRLEERTYTITVRPRD